MMNSQRGVRTDTRTRSAAGPEEFKTVTVLVARRPKRRLLQLGVFSAVLVARIRGMSRTAIAFGMVGLGGFVIDVVVFNVLRLGLFGPNLSLTSKPLTASVISAALAIVFNWLGSRYWAFRDDRRKDVLREFGEYVLVALLGLGIGLATLAFTHYTLGLRSLLEDNVSKNVIGLGLGTIARFLLLRFWVWGRRRTQSPELALPSSPRKEAALSDAPPDADTRVGEQREAPPMTALTTLVIIPTYNERENIAIAIAGVHREVPDVHVLVVDDASPDGTGAIAAELALRDERVHVLHRVQRDGLGGAYLAGFAWGLERGYQLLGEFDADGSHPAASLPAMRDALLGSDPADLAIGSRWVRGGSAVGWPRSRELLSRGGNAYAKVMLGLDIQDATAGFRLYRASLLRLMRLETVTSKGYCFQIDLTVRAIAVGAKIVEIPIAFQERAFGVSKMSRSIVLEAMAMVTAWGVLKRSGRPGTWLAARAGIPALNSSPRDTDPDRPSHLQA